ncbi:MAG: PadR family transcriptional regulator [Caldilinea sp. CFX5]|nr:PadR family transcriptional regulator [Caldilinea sp. CFX5]
MERELLLLGLLRQEEMHGYRLAEFIERDLTTCTDLKKSTAYFLLDKMAKQGWITQSQAQEGNRPPRRVYRITAAGEAQFQRLLRENLASHLPTYFASDVGLAFLDTLAPAEAVALLHQRRSALEEDLAAARAVPQHSGSWQLLVEHRRVYLEAELRWLDEVLGRLTTPLPKQNAA